MGTELIIMLTADAVAIVGAIGYFLVKIGKNHSKLEELEKNYNELRQDFNGHEEKGYDIRDRLTRIETKMDILVNNGHGEK